jgi:lipopolysaccharide/colanic/teichoic acid biosynthesis glycosyltransferase
MYEFLKRLIDLGAAALGLALLLPVLLLVAGCAWLGGLRPVLFRQWRTGYREQPFQLLKFCTMTQRRDAVGQLLPDSERLTALGDWLRRTSLDELPQLWNVLRGDLSLVGPRPFIHEYLPLYSAAQKVRFRVRPGITGWAQVNGRNAISWEEKFAYDAWYVEHRSLGLDFRILWRTAGRVLDRSGIAAAGGATMPAFRGTTTAE